jgi:hypothetical protein
MNGLWNTLTIGYVGNMLTGHTGSTGWRIETHRSTRVTKCKCGSSIGMPLIVKTLNFIEKDTSMKPAKLLCRVQTEYDRKTATGIATIKVPENHATHLARMIVNQGHHALNGEYAQYAPKLRPFNRIVAGYGVSIQYESGRELEIYP